MFKFKAFLWVVLVVLAVAFLVGTVRAADKEETEKGVVYKFKSQEEMQEFGNLYTAKMAISNRMGVLQLYFGLEQQNMQTVDGQIKEKFGIEFDPNKQYELNTDNMEIREIEAPTPPSAPAAPAQ